MRNFTVNHRLTQGILPVVVCVMTAGAAYWLYRDSPGLAGVHGVAEAREYTASSMEPGWLSSLEVVLGQRVSRGQVLASLDKGVLEQEIKVAEAELRELEAQVPAKGKSLDLSGLETDRTFQSDLEKAEVELGEARAECARTHAELAGVKEEISRQRELVQHRMAPADRMYQLQVRLTALQQAVTSCPSRIEALEKRKQAAWQRFDGWRSSGRGSLDGNANHVQLQPLRLRSTRQQEYLRLLKMRVENMVLRAPIDGYVVKVNAMTGSVLTLGEPLIVIVEANPQQVIAYLEEDRSYSVVAGDKALMRPRDRAGVPAEGTVAAVAATVSQMPQRFWPAPTQPRWGRQVFIRTDANHSLAPGEAFDITFKGRNEMLKIAPKVATAGSPETPPDSATAPLAVPLSLLSRSRFEPSGIIWLDKLQRYIAVSDDTGLEKVNDNSPWVFAIGRDGTVDPEPLVIEGIERVNDLEGIATSPDGRIYLIASQSENRKGIRRSIRTIFIVARLQADRLLAEGHVFFYDLLVEAGRSDPSFFASLGLDTHGSQSGPIVEIEGLAWHNGALFLGLKNPLDSSGRALIWKLGNPDSLFQRKSLSGAALTLWKKVPLQVEGSPAGISEIVFLPDGTLVLAGTNFQGGALFHAKETTNGELSTMTLKSFPGLKPEGLCLSPDRRLVVVFDQQQNNPLWAQLELPR